MPENLWIKNRLRNQAVLLYPKGAYEMFTTIGEDEIIALLSSDDWKERLRGEYYEVRIRYEKLKA